MPLHGKIVVLKRSGGDGTEFPLTATCLFGRRPDCDIRIQLPQVSKEHCRIDLNENKEIILTNLSSVNPTRVNGEALQQSERLKHGDVITIIDRSFRFEYPPAPTPKKRSSIGGKTETFKVLQDQQVGDTVTTETGDKRISEVSTDPHLKDGTNHDNIQRSLEKTEEVESKEDDSLLQSKTTSPFNDLYQMIKKSLDVKTPRKSSASVLQTPTSRFCTPRPGSVRKSDGKAVISTEDKSTPKKDDAKVSPAADETKEEAEHASVGTPKSVKKQRRSFQVPSTEMARPEAEEAAKSEAASPHKRSRTPPQRFTACEVVEQITATPKSPVRRRSKEAKPAVTTEQDVQASPKTASRLKSSPRNSGKVEKAKETSQKRKSGELGEDLPAPQPKKKRVSFGGFLCPELFDKRLPPDSPLRKGATPRRSLCASKPKQSLLRRASVIGLIQDTKMRTSPKSSSKNVSPKTPTSGKTSPKSRSPSSKAATPAKQSPKSRSPSPKAATPAKKSPKSRSPSPKAATPAKKSPKSRSPSPKAATPAKKSPKSRSASPKAVTPAKKSPKSRSPSPKAATPAKNSPKSKSPSPARGRSPTVSRAPGVQTPKVQGRFSVSLISTPSPIAEDTVTDLVPLVTATPKVPLRRRSTSRGTASVVKSAAKVMRRRSGISRASLKVKNSWADIVKFGQTKPQAAAPAKTTVIKKTTKKTVSKSQTPARKLKGHVSTGHADSPATIVVGRAHKQKVVYPTGAAPRLVPNVALLKKNMKMDEDLTGISEMLKTPVTERKRRSVIKVTKTPVGTSLIEPSVLTTPEEPGEMMVSPLSVSSTVKTGSYNSEAVRRLLNDDQESSFVSDTPALEVHSDDSSDQQCTDLKTTSVTTPKQKPELPESLTGVKRIMKTPRQKAEPVEDLRGRLLKTPKQKPEQQECLTGVKRIMKTPRQKAEPVEDLRGKLLKTPKQKPEQQECLTGVKRIMKTPRQKAEPVEDLRGRLLKTPKQKPEQQECLTGVKKMMETPRKEAEDVDDIRVELLATPKQTPELQESLTAAEIISETPQQDAEPLEDLLENPLETPTALSGGDEETPAPVQESEDLPEMTDAKTPDVKSSPCSNGLTDIKTITKMVKEKSAPVEDLVGVKRLMKTPREKGEAVQENFGIKRLVKTPRPSSSAPVEDFEGLQELMEEPLAEPTGPLETNKVADQMPVDRSEDVAKELDFPHEEPQDDVPSDVIDDVSQVDIEKESDAVKVVDDHLEEVPSGHDNDEDAMETISQAAVEEMVSAEHPAADETVSAEQPATDETVSAEQPTADETVSAEQPAADETVSAEQPATDETVSAEQPAADEMVSAEQPAADETVSAADETVSAEHPAADETVSAEQPAADETVSAEQPAADETVSAEQPKVDTAEENICQEQPMVETATVEVTEMDTTAANPDHEKKSVRGRRAKPVESKPAEDKQEAAESSEEPVVPAPVRGRRGKKTEAAAPPAVRQTTRGRNAKSQESTSDDQPETEAEKAVETLVTEIPSEAVSDLTSPVEDDSAPPAEEAVVKPVRGRKPKQQPPVRAKRGRHAKQEEEKLESAPVETTKPQEPATKLRRTRKADQDQASEDQAEMVQEVAPEAEMVPEPEGEQSSPVDVEPGASDSAAPQEKAVLKPRRGRKPKQPAESVPEQKDAPSDDVPQVDTAKEAEANEVCSGQQEVEPSGSDAHPSEATETVPQEPVTDSLPEVEAAVQKKSVRGRRAKPVESKPAEDKQEAAERSEEPVVPAPVRGRRGKKTEAAAPPAVRQTTRGRNAKSQESTSDDQPETEAEKAVETLVTEIPSEAVSDQTSPVEDDSAPPAEEAVVKPVRGRKPKPTPAEPPQPESEESEVVSDEALAADAQPEKSASTLGKPRRGRKAKPDTVEQNEVVEDNVVAVETKQQSQPPIRAKRGRHAKQEEEKLESASVEATKSQEPATKLRRTRKADQDQESREEEVQAVEVVVAEEAKAPVVAEPVTEQAGKPRRGGRKAKQDTESETPVESAEVPEVPAASSTNKLKRGRRGKQVTEEVEVTAVIPEEQPDCELEAEEEKNAEPDAPAVKPSRARGARTSVKNEVIPAKRARRGAALPLEETTEESTAVVSEPAPTSVQPARRGRRAATATSDQANPSEDVSSAAVEDAKMSKRAVKWKTDLEVFEIPKATPVKAVRGRKSKVDTESKNASKDADKTEEKDLSDTVAEAQPVKRARRGAKVADLTADEAESTSKVTNVEADAHPKTRRGRSAKK